MLTRCICETPAMCATIWGMRCKQTLGELIVKIRLPTCLSKLKILHFIHERDVIMHRQCNYKIPQKTFYTKGITNIAEFNNVNGISKKYQTFVTEIIHYHMIHPLCSYINPFHKSSDKTHVTFFRNFLLLCQQLHKQ